MQGYRLFFLDEKQAIVARDEFFAANDIMALLISQQLFDACSEEFHGYEIWNGARRLPAIKLNEEQRPISHDMHWEVQEVVLDRERVLLESRWRVARSKKLIDATLSLEESLRPQRRRN